MLTYTDTHCHIHEEEYEDKELVYQRAVDAGISRLICVGTDEKSSREAVAFASTHPNVWASVGIHPHESSSGKLAVAALDELLRADKDKKIVAIGECGLDYFYQHSPRDAQREMLHQQLFLAQKYNLPVIFHVRDGQNNEKNTSVWDDFWPIFDAFEALRGVLHSFTDNMSNLEAGLSRGLLVGVNGISTFTKDKKQQEMFASIPVNRLILETDAPYLTPMPHRGKVNEPAFITYIAQLQANLRSITLEELSRATERNATDIFF